MTDMLSPDSIKNFFSEFLEEYKKEVETTFSEKKHMFSLFNSPVKFDILFDRGMNYGVVILSKNMGSDFPEFNIDNSFQEPMMVVAMANSKRYAYGEQKTFLHLFHITSNQFNSLQVDSFVKDFIDYELKKHI